MKFQDFNKIPRLSRDMLITEKIDGTNAQIFIADENELEPLFDDSTVDVPAWLDKYCLGKKDNLVDQTTLYMFAGSRTRWIEIHDDNYGFANWVAAHQGELFDLGKGRHFGEWWGPGIQRAYGLKEKKYSLFNLGRWFDDASNADPQDEKIVRCPACCNVVPLLYKGPFDTAKVGDVLTELELHGSYASPGFMRPEGVVIFHVAANRYFKKTIHKDEEPKGKSKAE